MFAERAAALLSLSSLHLSLFAWSFYCLLSFAPTAPVQERREKQKNDDNQLVKTLLRKEMLLGKVFVFVFVFVFSLLG